MENIVKRSRSVFFTCFIFVDILDFCIFFARMLKFCLNKHGISLNPRLTNKLRINPYVKCRENNLLAASKWLTDRQAVVALLNLNAIY